MKINRNMSKRMATKKNIYKYIFTFIFTSILVLTIPGGSNKVYAAPLEDCDLDGFDDATGVPVPWPGYDETKGDTPEGPAGSKVTPTPAPTSTAENSKDSGTPSKTSGTDSENVDSTKTDSSKADSTNNGTGTNTDKISSTTSSNTKSTTKSTTADKTSKTDADKTSSTVKSNSTKVESDKEKNSTTSVNASNNVTDKTSNSTSDSGTKTEASTNTTSSGTGNSEADNTSISSTEDNNQEEINQEEDQQSEESTDNAETEVVEDENVEVVIAEGTLDYFNTVTNTKGTLDISEANGSILHVGSTVNILGTGFAGNVQNLEIQIQSEAKQLGIVNSSEDGSFEAKLSIPDDLEAGAHNIVVLYEGTEISRQQIELGPKAADSFLQALTVGFTSENKGLVPGSLILLGLLVVGVGSIGINALVRPKQYKK